MRASEIKRDTTHLVTRGQTDIKSGGRLQIYSKMTQESREATIARYRVTTENGSTQRAAISCVSRRSQRVLPPCGTYTEAHLPASVRPSGARVDAEREAAEGGALARQRVLDGAQLVQLIHGGRRSAAHASFSLAD